MNEPGSTTLRPERRHDLDALRLLATLLLIPFHTARLFDSQPWHIKNDILAPAMDLLVHWISNWHMPLFFLLAGAGISYSLRRRSAADFIDERMQRLLIPLGAGMLLVVPPQVYIERIGSSPLRQSPLDFEGSFFAFYPTFFTNGIYPDGNLSWHHLWFVMYLFLLSVALTPLFVTLRDQRKRQITRWAAWLSSGSRIFLMAVPLMIIRAALYGKFPGPQNLVNDATNLLTSATLLVYGYFLVADPRLQEAIDRHRVTALSVALAGSIGLGIGLITSGPPDPYSAIYFVIQMVSALTMWSWLLALFGFGHRGFNADRPWVRTASEIAYPFYIVHQTVIVVLSHYVVPLDLTVAGKFGLIAGASLVFSWLLAILIRQIPVTRFLFGVKLRHGRPRPAPAGSGFNPR